MQAFDVYAEALERMWTVDRRSGEGTGLSCEEKLRAVSIAYKLGCMAGEMQGMEDAEEKYLSWAVEKLSDDVHAVEDHSRERESPDKDVKAFHTTMGLQLPEWATITDIAAPFEALASFYARTDHLE